MKGEQYIINSLVLKNEKNPVINNIGKHSPLHIIEVIEDEYWREWKRKLEYAETPLIKVKYLGIWYTQLSPLKGYIRQLIKSLRKTRAKVEELKLREDFDPSKSLAVIVEKDSTLKLRQALKQLDGMRQVFIARYIRWVNKMEKQGKPNKARVNYEWFEFTFVK